ncbi:MAG TPA: hypothetical protein VNZ52_08060 [Candidatus Thermoplasmatota archaeon]|nr:hypothetical protein [Candidatus Thermoplasmatota archaeon]
MTVSPGAVTFETRQDHLLITPSPWMGALALKRSLIIPWSTLRRVSVVDSPKVGFALRRLGTNMPGLFLAGTVWEEGERTFHLYGRNDRCLYLILEGHTYDRVTVAVPPGEDVEGLAARIRSFLP